MPGLMDMFQPTSMADNQPISFGDAIGQRSNSLIGLGLGLMQPTNPWAGVNAATNALKGYQSGATADEAQARLQAAQRQHAQDMAFKRSEAARQASQFQQSFGLQQQQFDESGWRPGEFTVPETSTSPAQKIPFQQHVRTGEVRWPMGKPPGVDAAGTATTRPDPFAGATNPLAPEPTTTGGPAPSAVPAAPTGFSRPQLPPELENAPFSVKQEYWKKRADESAKGPSAHELASIEKADDQTMINKQVIDNLNYAKTLSPKAPAGPLASASDYVAGIAPQYMSEQTKNRLLLKNAVTSNAVEQLKSIFGGNPSEGERKILLDMQGSVDQPDAVRQEVYNRAIVAANKRLELNQQRSQQIRSGSYYKPGGGGQQGTAAQPGTVRRYNPDTGRIE